MVERGLQRPFSQLKIVNANIKPSGDYVYSWLLTNTGSKTGMGGGLLAVAVCSSTPVFDYMAFFILESVVVTLFTSFTPN